MIVTILIGVVSLAVLVLAFLAARSRDNGWHWAHVLTLVVFYFAAVGYAILGARSLNLRVKHQQGYAKKLVQIEEQAVLNEAVERGAPAAKAGLINKLAARELLAAQEAADEGEAMPGANDLEHQLRMISRVRGRVWRFVQPGPIDPETLAIRVGFPIPQPAAPAEEDGFADEATEPPAGPPPAIGLEVDAIVYAFEQGPLQGSEEDQAPNRYIGEFRVSEVEGRTAVLDPLDQLSLDEVATDRLQSSRSPWIVYETMPADSRDLFGEVDPNTQRFTPLPEEALRELLPEASVVEYLRDGSEATPDDPLERVEGVDEEGRFVADNDPDRTVVRKLYRRRLRDYAFLLNDFERDRAALVARRQALEADITNLTVALKDAETLEAYRRNELAKWRSDLDAVERERRAIESHVAALQRQVANARSLLADTLQENAKLATARAAERGVLVPMGSGSLDIDAL